ncbi:MAG: 50S ribosomal protein L3 [Candidatus Moanabacter tarae]|uniref:Large ribosomal subunit protein uL3 n=1 Tax=Candidatus Moanibacter tarae TaxID=2200854 RepID=A0A2Z4AKS6_9BACT|nr:MAG: 50S ribosomal protein L3 [Candidatus Moanabacter tarae]|tara:strand:+ start:5239 stop:5877 length:639 start_codon:yes stop_codon:yes gene_type:complete
MLYTLLGTKIGMTQVFDSDGRVVPVTVIKTGPCPVVQIKTEDRDGYSCLQIGYGEIKAGNVSKSERGHTIKAKVDPLRRLKEVRFEGESEHGVGDVLTASGFSEGETVDVLGVSKGQGFQGVVKRFGFKGGPSSHGSMFHRRGGSYGQCQWPGEVHKGRKMPGRMGGIRRTVQNLEVIKILEDQNVILVKGSIPGPNGGEVLVRRAKKSMPI